MDVLISNASNRDQPFILGGAGLAPLLAAGQTASDASVVIANLPALLYQQEQRYSNGEQPPVLVQQQPYDGPPLRYLLTGRQVKFCTTKEEAVHQYQTVPEGQYFPVPEYAASVQGPNGAGIVRARINTTGKLRRIRSYDECSDCIWHGCWMSVHRLVASAVLRSEDAMLRMLC
jgi:Ni,Fe-hydrogenase I large subunit